MSDASSWVAAGAAVVAAIVVAWQSWETRRSADASGRAAVAANAALELTRQQAAEAVRARIDASTPTITVSVPLEAEWPPVAPSGYAGGEAQPIVVGIDGSPMHMPRDKARQIAVRVAVKVINESDVHLLVNCPGLVDKTMQPIGPVHLEPRGVVHPAWFAVTHTLEDWVALYRAREAGAPPEPEVGIVHYFDPADTGAIDTWELSMDGCPVEPVPDLDSGWRLLGGPLGIAGNTGGVSVGPVIRIRQYYLSKRRNEKLPD